MDQHFLTSYYHAALSVVLGQFGIKGFADGPEGIVRLVEASPFIKASIHLPLCPLQVLLLAVALHSGCRSKQRCRFFFWVTLLGETVYFSVQIVCCCFTAFDRNSTMQGSAWSFLYRALRGLCIAKAVCTVALPAS